MTATDPGGPQTVDFYVGLALPDGDTVVSFTSGGGFTLGHVSNLATLQPIATRVSLATPFAISVPDFFSHTWTVGDPRGNYVFFILAVLTGALGDGAIGPTELVGLGTARFSLSP